MTKIHASFLSLILSICIIAVWSVLDLAWRADFAMFLVGIVGLVVSISCLIAFAVDET